MSRVVKTRVTEPKEETYTAEVRCDLCGELAPQPGCYYPWEESYDVVRPEVRMQTGEHYPEGGSGETTFFDICPGCFTSKVVPALKAMGAEPVVETWDC